jgi:hypothetical protein
MTPVEIFEIVIHFLRKVHFLKYILEVVVRCVGSSGTLFSGILFPALC